MTLSSNDAQRLIRAGFTQFEVRALSQATDPSGNLQPMIDIDSPVWQDVISKRQGWIQDKVAREWTEEEIDNAIMNYYTQGAERSPWDFLKVEYRPPGRIDYLTAIRKFEKDRIKSNIRNTMGEY